MAISRRVMTRYIAKELYNGADRSALLTQLAAYIVLHRLQSSVELIVADIARMLRELGTVSARVITARQLNAELRDAVIAYIQRIEGASTVELDETVDASLIGGIVVQTPNKRLDASIATTLKNLRST